MGNNMGWKSLFMNHDKRNPKQLKDGKNKNIVGRMCKICGKPLNKSEKRLCKSCYGFIRKQNPGNTEKESY